MPEEETCPRCGSKVIPQTDDDGKVTYVCERNLQRRCDFITWDVPTKDFCPSCGKTLFKRSGRGQARTFCENEACEKFVPLEERGYRKKQTKEEISADTKETSAKTAAKTRKSAKTTKSSGTAASAGTRARKPK
jgi:DNA topoisomerase-1